MSARHRVVSLGLIALLFSAGCAAGDARFTAADPAGFFGGLWHGMIACITLIIGIFSDSVGVYERDNTGGWYDFGFLLGVTMVWGRSHVPMERRQWRRRHDEEWAEIGQKVEAKMKRKVRAWAEAEPDDEWDVVEAKAEEKLKRRFRAWAEEP